MVKKTIYVSRPASLSLKDRQFVIHFKDDGSLRIVPVEDIGFVVLENQQIAVTVPLIAALSENNVAIVFCDNHLMPVALSLAFEGNSVQQEVLKNQLSASVPLNKNLWKQIIISKIENQAALLDKVNRDGSRLHRLAKDVKSGDSDNKEGIAARIYWQSLFGSGFYRSREGMPPNNLLNYGYSILRSAVARAIVGSGLNPGLGVFHRNRYNAFPLADDLMEPFRPFVDEIVFNLWESGVSEMNREIKASLLSVLSCDTIFNDECKPLMVGLSSSTASMVRCYSKDSAELVLPKFS